MLGRLLAALPKLKLWSKSGSGSASLWAPVRLGAQSDELFALVGDCVWNWIINRK